jgi:hypothetical protein
MEGKYTSEEDRRKFGEALLKEMANCNWFVLVEFQLIKKPQNNSNSEALMFYSFIPLETVIKS